MGLGLYPVFDPRLTGPKPPFLGEMLGDAFRELDRVAAQHGLTRLTSFADTRTNWTRRSARGRTGTTRRTGSPLPPRWPT